MRVVFFGTPVFAVSALASLCEAGHQLLAAVSQPDRPAGRGQVLEPTPVKRYAESRGIPVEQPERLREDERARIAAYEPEVLAVAAYGKILPKTLLELPPLGAVNVHASLLPRHRGAAPIQRAILAGDDVTGITIMQMNERMDEGDILLQKRTPIRDDDTGETLSARLASLGGEALVEALDRLERGDLRPVPQVEAEATYAPRIDRSEGEVSWGKSALEIARAARAFDPWPGCWTRVAGRRLKLFDLTAERSSAAVPPGTVIASGPDALVVATGGGRLRIGELQIEGRRRLPARDFLSGAAISPGTCLG